MRLEQWGLDFHMESEQRSANRKMMWSYFTVMARLDSTPWKWILQFDIISRWCWWLVSTEDIHRWAMVTSLGETWDTRGTTRLRAPSVGMASSCVTLFEIGPALKRARTSGRFAIVNVRTDETASAPSSVEFAAYST